MALQEHYAGQVEFIVADLDNPNTDRLLREEGFEVLYIPMFVFINSGGEVVSEEAGVFDFEDMEARIDPLIGEAAQAEELSRLDYFFSEQLPGTVAQRSLLTLAIVFIGGLITSISPCILSMVPLLVSYIGGYGDSHRQRGFSLSLSFVVGLAGTFAILGFIAAGFGRVFGEIGAIWYYLLAAVAVIMGLQLLGVLTFDLPGLKKITHKKVGLGGSLVTGMLFGLVASPCATPVLAVIITYAAVQAEPLYGSGLLFIYGLGHGVPLLAAGTFTGMAKNLPAISRYTQYLSYISGTILVILGLVLLAWINWI